MTFLLAQTEVANSMHLSVTADATRIKFRLNMAKDAIVAASRWWFTASRAMFQTAADYTTGTVALTNASGTVTGTSTVWTAAMVNRWIQFSGETDWYEVTARASNTSITITPSYSGSTTSTNVTYIIRAVSYSLAADVDVVYDVRQFANPEKLVQLSPREYDRLRPNPVVTGKATHYIVWPRTTGAGVWRVELYPTADAIFNVEYRYFRTIPDLSADGDICEIPAKWHWVWVEKAKLFYAEELGDEAAIARIKGLYDAGIQEMLANNEPSVDQSLVLRGGGDERRSRWLNYGPHFESPD